MAVAWRPRPWRRILGLPAGQLACWLAALLLVGGGANRSGGSAIGLGLGAATLAASGWRYQGNWAYEWLLLWLRYRARRRLLAEGGDPSPELAVVDAAVSLRAVSDVDIGGVETAFVDHGAGMTAVLELGIDQPWTPTLPLDLVLRHVDSERLTIQLIVHTGLSSAVTAPRRAWLAVRVRRDEPRSGGLPAQAEPAVLADTVARLLPGLRAYGLLARPVSAARLPEVLQELTWHQLSAGGEPPRPEPSGAAWREQWRALWTRDMPQECLRLLSWPGLPAPPAPDLCHALLAIPGAASTMSLAAARVKSPAGAEAAAVELVVRVAAQDRSSLDTAAHGLRGRLAAAGARVDQLPGRQLSGLAATLPLGGLLPGYEPSSTAHPPAPWRHRGPDAPQPAEPPHRSEPAGPTSAPPAAPARAELVGVPTALRGATARTPAAAPALPYPVIAPPSYPGASPPPYQAAAAPDLHEAVRAYGASLFTAESARRAYLEELVTLARTSHQSPQLVSVLAGQPRLGASTTAAGLARTLATVRDDYTALLSIDTGPVNNSKLLAVCRDHAFTVVDLGAHTGEETPQALALSTRIVVVASADRRATPVTRLTLDRVSQVSPSLVAGAVIVVACKNDRQYRRVIRELGSDLSPQAAQIIPIPPDPALRAVTEVNLAKLRAPTKEAYLRLAATLASAQPAPGNAAPTPPARRPMM